MRSTLAQSRNSGTSRSSRRRLGFTLWALIAMVCCTIGTAKASHYAGFEYRIDWVAGETYDITFKIYRDCRGIALANPHPMQLVRLANNATQNFSVQRVSVTDITPLCPGQISYCTAPAANRRGITENVYVQRVTGLFANENYRVQSSNSARNAAITTGPDNELMFIYANFRTGIQNSSPRFLNKPIGDFCVNQPAVFSPNGFDPDGDAIVYSLQNCLESSIADPSNYTPPYNGLNPLSSSTPILLNPSTGALTFTPNMSGQVAIICLRADEFRNGVIIGSVVRDMQVNILNCSNTPPVVGPQPNVVVNVGQTYCTTIVATDANGDLITLTAVSGIIPPATFVQNTNNPGSATGTFCFTPTLAHAGNTFTVTVNATDNACPTTGTGVVSFNITVPLPCNMTATATATPTVCGGNTGTATVVVTNGTAPFQFSWTGPSGYTSSNQTITGLAAGTYDVLVVDGNSCVARDTVEVTAAGSAVTATATTTPANCNQNNGTLTISASGGTPPYSYSLNGGPFQASNTFTGLATGTYTFTVQDVNGCSFTGTATVGEARDVTLPTITCPANITVNNDPGICGAAVTFAAATATDDCGSVTVTQTGGGASGSVFPVGTSTVTFTATDGSGNTASCSFTITVIDNENPTITCPGNITVNNTPGQCGAAVSYQASASDNCAATVSYSIAPGSNFPVGTTTVTATATDPSGNTATCSFTVTVVDNENPTISCPANITVNNTPGQCGANVSYSATATDNCAATVTYSTAPGSFFPVGTTTVTATATDPSGNSVSCSFTVTVVDNENPTISCPANITVNNTPGQCGANVSYSATATDNCSATVTYSIAPGSFFPVGTTTVTATATDPAGNSVSCSFTVTVVDAEAPNAVCQNVTVQLNSSGTATITASQVNNGSTDNCGIASITVSPNTFNCSNVSSGGPTQLFFSEYIEGSGNNKCVEIYNGTGAAVNLSGYSIDMYFNGSTTVGLSIPLSGIVANGDVWVVCQATAAPVFLAQADQTNAGGWYNGDDAVVLRFGTTNIDIIGSIGEDPGTAWTGGGNSTLDRTLVRNANVASGNTSNASGFPAIASEWTGFPNNTSTNLGSHTATSGGNTVTLTVTDNAGNTSTCTASVTVQDNVPPTANCQNVTVTLDANGNASVTASQVNNGSTDNCGIASITVSPNTFGCANVGSNGVVLTVTDLSGNVATCSATVTVQDNTPPTALCQSITVQLDGNGQATITAQDIDNGSFDNCGIQSLSVSPNTFDCGDVVTPVTINELFISEYIEGSGNNKCVEIYNGTGAAVNMSGYQLQFYFNGSAAPATTLNLTGTVAAGDVFVVCQSGAAPQFLAQADFTSGASFFNGDDAVVLVHNGNNIDIFGTIGQDPGAQWSVAGNTTEDNTLVRNANVTSGNTTNAPGFPTLGTEWTQFPNDYSASLGAHFVNTGSPVVTLTVTDVNGNTSTCTATVTVEDNTPPTITCPANITVNSTPGQCGAAVSYQATATDNCGATVSYSIAPGSFFPVGTTTVTATATDPSGNASTCSFTVTVVDNENPTISCPANITVNNNPGQCGAVVSYQATATDNCAATVSYSIAPGSFFPVGTTTVTATATDPSGNSVSCSFTVTVVDNENPTISCPANITVNNTPGQCGANVSYSATATDNCSATVTYSIAPGSFFPVGTTTVTATATDPAGNSVSCSFTVTVVDNEAPTIVCPANVSVACVRDIPAPNTSLVTASDNCGVASITHVGDATTGTGCAGNPRIVTRTYRATDVNGNSATCTQTLVAEATPVVATASGDVVVFPQIADSSCATISVTASGGCAPYTYLWSNGSTATSQTVCPTVTTTYYVTVTDAQGCTDVDSVRVCAINLTCSGGTNNGQTGNGQGGNGSTNGNGMVHIAVCHIPPGNPNNQMTKCLPIPAALQHIQLGHGGDYLGPCGSIPTRPCRGSGNAKMAAQPAGSADLSTAVSMHVFPNPTNGNLNVEVACRNCGDEGTYTLKVTDIYGKQMMTTELEVALGEGVTKLDLSNLSAGVYMIIVESGDQRIVERVVKQ